VSLSWETKSFGECTADDVFEFSKLRTDIFFLEQAINEEELDQWDRDPETLHVWCRSGDEMVGYARLVTKAEADGADLGVRRSIGRVVVAPSYRRQGIAGELVSRCVDIAGPVDLIVHAQDYIQTFYAQHGFAVVGEPFDEAGIPHVRMVRYATRQGPS
jgi:ElaA protein